MIVKKIFSLTASTISLIILFFLFSIKCNAEDENSKLFLNDEGVLAIMYHRFNETKYPSTNIMMNVFSQHMNLIKKSKFDFFHPKEFENKFDEPKKQKKILLTIDDGFKSFYDEAWPYLNKHKIPFILFISTEPVGKFGYMNWDEIKEVEDSEFGFIGHHSHTHEYLIDMKDHDFINDIETATNIFKEKIGYSPQIFSYPFGEYSLYMKKYISKNFKIAFGQHSGVIDINKDKFELPRFPINEKYGEMKRFKSLINYLPLEYKSIKPEEKKLTSENNPPKLVIEFFKEQKNIKNINCYSDDGGNWKRSNLSFNDNILIINFDEKFIPRRGRINCSLNEGGKWKWFGTQFTVQN